MRNKNGLVKAINWNQIEDDMDKEVWDRLVKQFWIDTRFPISNDIPTWNTLTDQEKDLTIKVFTGLTLLDTLQSSVGAISLIPDAITPHEEAVYANIAFMEAFSAETELLTPQGWKRIDQVTDKDKVAQYDPETGEITFATPTLVPSHFAEEVYEIKANNGNARQVVSGGHRVYYEEKEELNNSSYKWIPKTAEARDLYNEIINYKSSFRRFRTSGTINGTATLTPEDRLKIAIQADGSFKAGSSPRYTGEKKGIIPVHFDLTKERKKTRLLELAIEAGWNIKTLKTENRYILEVPLNHIGDREKHFDSWWNLNTISKEWAEEFIKESGLWDGHTLKGGYGVTYYTTDKRNSDFYIAIATLAGYRSRTTTRVDNRSDAYKDTYVTNVTYNKNTVNGQSMVINKVEPQQVYCVQVPTTYLLTRNGNSPVISGNCVHAKSYSSIFSTLCSTQQIKETFRWSEEQPNLITKEQIIQKFYEGQDPHRKKIASTLLESFLFYSGFYLPLYWASKAKLTNTADMIKLIIRDESVHGSYIGYKYQKNVEKLPQEQQEELKMETYSLLLELYDNELEYTRVLYDDLGLTEDVSAFLRFNANKALMNLGYDPLFPVEDTKANPAVMSALSLSTDTGDFFSGTNTYVLADNEDTTDDDWAVAMDDDDWEF